MKKVNEGDHLL